MPVATKVIKAKVVKPTRKKWNLLNREYKNFQLFLHGLDVPLYSATKQQAEKLLDDIGGPKQGKEYPVVLRRDTVKLEERNTKIAQYWFKLPVADEYGGVWCPIKPHTKIKPEWSIRETKLLKKGKTFYLHIAVQKEVEYQKEYLGVLGIDLGLRKFITAVVYPSRDTLFLGEEIKRIRRHWLHLRKEAKDIKSKKQWRRREKRKIEDVLHKLTKKIIAYTKRKDLLIAIGNLKGLREKDRGKIMNEWLSKFPFYKFKRLLKYKAKWKGIRVIEVSEYMTSQLCSRCGKKGKRKGGLFKCPYCGLECNADRNGALNIAIRGLGAVLNPPSKLEVAVTLPESSRNDITAGVYSKLLNGRETLKSSAGDG